MNNLEQLFYEALPKGCENLSTARELQQITGFSPREIRLIVNKLRQDGKIIGSGDYGYFVPDLDCEWCKALFQQSAARNRKQSIETGYIAGILEMQLEEFQV